MVRKEIGTVFPTKNFGDVIIIDKLGNDKFKIKFIETGNIREALGSNLVVGAVKDLEAKIIERVACIGTGKYKSNGNLPEDAPSRHSYSVWYKMILRCYNEKEQMRIPAYKGCSVCDEWLNFQNFAEWHSSQIGFGALELDKDLLIRGNKIYSPSTCTLIPYKLNIALQERRSNCGKYPPGVYYKKKNRNYIAQLAYGDGVQKHLGSFATPEEARDVYLKAKKLQLKALADKYKDEIEERAFLALYNWEPSE